MEVGKMYEYVYYRTTFNVFDTYKMADEDKSAFNVREFSEVILTLDNVLLPAEKLSPTPSMIDGIDNSTEMDLRILGCELIQISGILLKLPQVRMNPNQNVTTSNECHLLLGYKPSIGLKHIACFAVC